MKFKIVLFLILFGALMATFWIGYRQGQKTIESTLPTDSKVELNKITRERDSLHSLFIASGQREQKFILQHESDSLLIISKERAVAVRESKIKTYQQRLDEMISITIAQPDSFLIKRYPDQ